MNAKIFRVSRTWFAEVEGKTVPLTNQTLMSTVHFEGSREGIVRLVGGQAELVKLQLRPEDFK